MNDAVKRLYEWNEGEPIEAGYEETGYEPGALEWQRDLRTVLNEVASLRAELAARPDGRDYKGEYNTLAAAIVGETGLSAILEADKARKLREALGQLPDPQVVRALARFWKEFGSHFTGGSVRGLELRLGLRALGKDEYVTTDLGLAALRLAEEPLAENADGH